MLNSDPKPRRRWFQFSIGTILLLMVIAALLSVIWRDRLELRWQQVQHKVEVVRLNAQEMEVRSKMKRAQEEAAYWRLESRKLQSKLEEAGSGAAPSERD